MAKTKHLKSLGSKKTKYTFKVNPKLLETFPSPLPQQKADEVMIVPFVMPNVEFTSLCPKTSQPDFARIEIVYVPRDKMIESKSLKLYLFSYRNHGAFHEECVQTILEDLWKVLEEPYFIRVTGDFTPRGGLAIKPMAKRFAFSITPEHRNSILSMVAQFDIKGLGI